VEDVARGGWIVAIGLSPTRPTEQECMKRALPSGTYYRPALTSAFQRVSHSLQNTQKAFLANRFVEEVLRLVDTMTPDETTKRKKSTRSKIHYMIRHSNLAREFSWDSQNGSWVDYKVKGYASTLSNEQCMMAIEVFNRYEDQLSAEVVEALEPILMTVLRAVLLEIYQVMDYFDRREHFQDVQLVKVLKELESKRKPIYLREWRVGDEE
jgi:hypothetical protein